MSKLAQNRQHHRKCWFRHRFFFSSHFFVLLCFWIANRLTQVSTIFNPMMKAQKLLTTCRFSGMNWFCVGLVCAYGTLCIRIENLSIFMNNIRHAKYSVAVFILSIYLQCINWQFGHLTCDCVHWMNVLRMSWIIVKRLIIWAFLSLL